jgi:hypothetical protein
MPYTQVANLDYNDIKIALKEYLRSQSDFTDYDFEGSVWSTLLDVLAYNTYYTAFNTNLVVNELFLDSATLRDNVVGIAKQLGYTPKSVTSPVAYISFDVNFSNTTPDTAILRTGSAFTTIFDSELYQYTTLDDISAPVENGTASFIDVPIYEGSLVKNSYTVNTALKSQRFIIQNQGVDTSSLRVKVYPSQNSSAFEFYDRAENILDVNSTTKSYFLNEIEDENYELFFGDGVLGKKLETGQFIEVSYLVTNGPSTNGAKTFVFNGIVDDKDNAVYPLTVSVNSVTAASGGENIESIEKIKFNAPRYFGTQDRAVTSQDYAAIVRNVYPAVADIITFGGETADPPEYGKVKIVIKPSNASLLSSFTKQDIIRKLKPYTVASVTAEIIDPSILYVELTSKIYFDRTRTNLPPAEIVKKVRTSVEQYIDQSDTEKFNGKFRYSKFVGVIDDADRSINSNQTTVMMRKDFIPAINSTFFYEVCFQNAFDKDCEGPTLHSTGFVTSEFPQYTSYLEDRNGKIVLYRIDDLTGLKIVLNDSAGEINYEKGEIMLYDLTIIRGSFEDNRIELRVKPLSNDINAVREVFLDVDMTTSKFTAYPE